MKQDANVIVGGPLKDVAPCQYKTKILKANLPFKGQVENDPNTKFVIKWDFDLKGETVTIPENCILEFDGGSLKNGTIVGISTKIVSNTDNYIFDNVEIDGTWDIPSVNSNIIKDIHSPNRLYRLFALTDDSVYNEVIIEAGNYYLDKEADDYRQVDIKSNTHIHLNGNIYIRSVNANSYYGFNIDTKENILIEGSGSIIGDRETNVNPSEYGWCIYLFNANDITLKGITCSKSHGDGIYFNGVCNNVTLLNCTIDDCRRNGVSFGAGSNYLIQNCIFTNIGGDTGANPKCALEFESDHGYGNLDNIEICNNVFKNNTISILFNNRFNTDSKIMSNIFIVNNYFENCPTVLSTQYMIDDGIKNIKITNNTIVSSEDIYAITGFILKSINQEITNNYFECEKISANRLINILSGSKNTIVKNNFIKGDYCVLNAGEHTSILNNIIECTGTTAGEHFAVLDNGEKSTIEHNDIIGNVRLCKNNTVFNYNQITFTVGVQGIIMKYSAANTPIENCIIKKNKFILPEGVVKWAFLVEGKNNKFIDNESTDPSRVVLQEGTYGDNYFEYNYVGTNSERPGQYGVGIQFYDTTIKKPIWKNESKWYDAFGIQAGTPSYGSFEDRPTVSDNGIPVGYKYFCINRYSVEGGSSNPGIEIIHKGDDVWVDTLGRPVS